MASFFDDEAEVGTTDDEDEMETEGTLKVRKFLNIRIIWSKIVSKSITRLWDEFRFRIQRLLFLEWKIRVFFGGFSQEKDPEIVETLKVH